LKTRSGQAPEAHTYKTLATQEAETRWIMVRSQPRQTVRPYLRKKKKKKKACGVMQVVEHLPSKLEALSSNPNAANKKARSWGHWKILQPNEGERTSQMTGA
jgi:hypothetical protein